jgi:hypothetical protein
MTRVVRVRAPALAALVVALALVAGCSAIRSGAGTTTIGQAPYEQGSGIAATESRSLDSFHGVSAAQGVQVEVSTGSPGITVSADDNLIDRISTRVADGVLVVDVSGSVQTRLPLKVVVSMATPPDRLSASTGATIDAESLAGPSLSVEASTGATVRGGGRVDDLRVTAVGGATADLRNVESARAEVDVNTGSTAHVNAGEAVTGSCSTGSTLRVHGAAPTSGVAVDTTSTLANE